MSQPNLLLMGVGNIAQSVHIPYLKQLKVNVVAAMDSNQQSLNYVQSQYPNIKLIKKLNQIPKWVNTALICSPTSLHYIQTKYLLNRGIHVLCEKPLSKTGSEAECLISLARRKNVVLQVGYYRRFHLTSKFIINVLKRNQLGPLLFCRIYAGQILKPSDISPSMFDKKLSGGGVLLDFGSHLLDRLFSWFENISLENYYDDFLGGVESSCLIKLKVLNNKNEIPVEVKLSRTNNFGNYSQLEFKEYGLKLDHNIGGSISVSRKTKVFAGHDVILNDEIKLTDKENSLNFFIQQWIEFVDRINGLPQIYSNLDDALKVNRLIDLCYKKRKKLIFNWEKELEKDL